MFYFAVSPSAINSHCCALEASAPACLPQVGIQLGVGAISFGATACPLQSFVKKRWSCPSGENSGLLGNIKKRRKTRDWNRKENSEEMSTKTKKISRIAVRGHRSLACDEWQHWAKYVLETKALSPSCAFSMKYTSPPPTPSFLIKWLQLHLSIRSSPLQRLDKGLLSVAC